MSAFLKSRFNNSQSNLNNNSSITISSKWSQDFISSKPNTLLIHPFTNTQYIVDERGNKFASSLNYGFRRWLVANSKNTKGDKITNFYPNLEFICGTIRNSINQFNDGQLQINNASISVLANACQRLKEDSINLLWRKPDNNFTVPKGYSVLRFANDCIISYASLFDTNIKYKFNPINNLKSSIDYINELPGVFDLGNNPEAPFKNRKYFADWLMMLSFCIEDLIYQGHALDDVHDYGDRNDCTQSIAELWDHISSSLS